MKNNKLPIFYSHLSQVKLSDQPSVDEMPIQVGPLPIYQTDFVMSETLHKPISKLLK